jgi:hypothetical protein
MYFIYLLLDKYIICRCSTGTGIGIGTGVWSPLSLTYSLAYISQGTVEYYTSPAILDSRPEGAVQDTLYGYQV